MPETGRVCGRAGSIRICACVCARAAALHLAGPRSGFAGCDRARACSQLGSSLICKAGWVGGRALHHTWHPDTHSSSATASSPSFASCSDVIGNHFSGTRNWFGLFRVFSVGFDNAPRSAQRGGGERALGFRFFFFFFSSHCVFQVWATKSLQWRQIGKPDNGVATGVFNFFSTFRKKVRFCLFLCLFLFAADTCCFVQ